MPENAIAADHPEHVVPVAGIASLVAKLAAEPVVRPRFDLDAPETDCVGDPSPFSCPECGGVLREVDDEAVLRVRCRVGHAFAAQSLVGAESDTIDQALWTALRALEKRVELSRRVARRLRSRELSRRAERYERQAVESQAHVKVLREVLLGRSGDDAGD